jgi:hypothetical protein
MILRLDVRFPADVFLILDGLHVKFGAVFTLLFAELADEALGRVIS